MNNRRDIALSVLREGNILCAMQNPLFVPGCGPILKNSFVQCTRCPQRVPWKRRPYRPPANISHVQALHATARVEQERQRRNGRGEIDWRRQNNTLTSVAKRDGIDAAVALLSEIAEEGLAAPQNFNQVVSLLVTKRRFDDGFRLALEAGKRGLANIITFRPLMKHCCTTGNGKGAKRIWSAMMDLGIEGDMFIYAELMGALVRAQDLTAAQKVLSDLLDTGKTPHIVLYNTLLKGFAKRANVRKAFEILRTIEESGIRPDETTFNTVLNTCVRAKDADSLGKAMAMMRRSNIKPGVPTFNTLLKLYSRTKNFNDALQIYEEMQQTVEPSIVTFNTLIDGCAHRGDMAQAAKFFDELVNRGMTPDICTMTSLLKGFGRAREPERAVELYEAMKEGGYSIEERTRYAVINACLRSGDYTNAKRLMCEMLDAGCSIRVRTWVWMLENEVGADAEELVLDTLAMMQKKKVSLDAPSKQSLLKEMKERGGFLLAINQLKSMSADGSTD